MGPFEKLKEEILAALSPDQIRLRTSNIRDVEGDSDPIEAREYEDEHRKSAHGTFDLLLEEGRITPEVATQRKAYWDVIHGY